MTKETRVIMMLMSMLAAVYIFAHFTGLENAFNMEPIVPLESTPPIKVSSFTTGHFTLLFYPSKSKTEILYIEGHWKKKAEFKYVTEIAKEFPPNFTKKQVKAYILAKAKGLNCNVVVVNWLSTHYKSL